jgi:hypothetical protein
MTPTAGHSAYHLTNIRFLQEAGPICNFIHNFDLRTWAWRYTVWLRDRKLVVLPAPPIPNTVDVIRAAKISAQLDAMAEKYFGKL